MKKLKLTALLLVLLFLFVGCEWEDSSYQRGNLDGYREGYEEGVMEGNEAGYSDGYEDAINGVRQLLQCGENESIEDRKIALMEFHLEDGYREGYKDACLALPHYYESKYEIYERLYWTVYDPETGELRPGYKKILQDEIDKRNIIDN